MDQSVPVSKQWVQSLPLRWARNGLVLALLFEFGRWGGEGSKGIQMLLQSADLLILCLIEVAFMAIIFSIGGWVLGLAARRSLRLPMQLGADVAANHVLSKWVTGAVALGLLSVLIDVVFKWRDIAHRFGANVYEDVGYLFGVIFFAALIGLITGLISRPGLRKAIELEKQRAS